MRQSLSRPAGLAALNAALVALALGCSGGKAPLEPALQPDALAALTPAEALTNIQIHEPGGSQHAAMGLYWLERDPADPLTARLVHEPVRSAQAGQGDLYALSIRPFLEAQHLVITDVAPGPDGTTDYTVQFTHPIAMPPDVVRPQSATKRVDLFVNDVQAVLAVNGADLFFNGQVRTNLSAMPNANGFRMVGPMVNLAGLGVGAGTNVFPYKLFTRANHSNPRGNYGTQGWTGATFLTATGFDVIPHAASATTVLRISNVLSQPLPIVMLAKYMDPRKGITSFEKRTNRLPDPNDITACRYFLPEAAGDLQDIAVAVAGDLRASSSADIATVSAVILDWDNASTKAIAFPNHSVPTQNSEISRPTQIEASFPQLRASGSFSGSVGSSSGLASEFITVTVAVTNVDQTYTVQNILEGDTVWGLLRVRETQDSTDPIPYVVNEALLPQTLPAGFELSTRFQRVPVKVLPAGQAPQVTNVAPTLGGPGAVLSPVATLTGGTPTSWNWSFGGGATPNTSTDQAPTITLGSVGTYPSSVTVANIHGNNTYNFNLNVSSSVPSIAAVNFSSLLALRASTASATASGSPTSWSWNFGGGATPNTSTAASPALTLAAPGVYNGSVTATNGFGTSAPYAFQFTVVPKMIGLRVRIITNGSTFPKRLIGMPTSGWSEVANVNNWITTYMNPMFINTGVQFDTSLTDYGTINNPALFNIDNTSEENQLWNIVLGQSANRLNTVVINSQPNAPGLGGVMSDGSCNQNNTNRGCYIIPFTSSFDYIVWPHELGHVMNLPHIRTNTNPLTSANYNLMSYGTSSTALSSNITREASTSCIVWSGNPMNQHTVVNNWVHTHMP